MELKGEKKTQYPCLGAHVLSAAEAAGLQPYVRTCNNPPLQREDLLQQEGQGEYILTFTSIGIKNNINPYSSVSSVCIILLVRCNKKSTNQNYSPEPFEQSAHVFIAAPPSKFIPLRRATAFPNPVRETNSSTTGHTVKQSDYNTNNSTSILFLPSRKHNSNSSSEARRLIVSSLLVMHAMSRWRREPMGAS